MRMLLWTMGLGLALLCGSTAAQMAYPGGVLDTRPWSEVEAIMESADAARAGGMKFKGPGQAYYFAADGRLALLVDLDDAELAQMHELPIDPEQYPASLGRHETRGAWITLRIDTMAYRTDAARDAAVKELLEAYGVESEAELAALMAADEDDGADEAEADAAAAADADADAAPPESHDLRMLRVPYRSGELLVSEQALTWIAKAWDGQGPLKVMPSAWRLPPAEMTLDEDGSPVFEIANPLSAGLPVELSGLLRRDAIEGRVAEVLDTPETLAWESHEADVRVRLDRGANHGMYVGMDVFGLPPDEAFFATVTALKGEDSEATLSVSRFSPRHAPSLPSVGLRVTTRRAAGVGCHIDSSAAVRAKVLAVAQSKKSLAWDEDGFAFVEMTIDQGSRHGLAAGDTLNGEIDEVDGKGLVTAVEPERATVLWRMHRYADEQPMRMPAVGEALVTPAWRRAEWETFGSGEH